MVDDVEIVVVDIRGGKVRIGVKAPKTVAVHRREVYDAIHRNATPLSITPLTSSALVENYKPDRCWTCLGSEKLPTAFGGSRPCPECTPTTNEKDSSDADNS